MLEPSPVQSLLNSFSDPYYILQVQRAQAEVDEDIVYEASSVSRLFNHLSSITKALKSMFVMFVLSQQKEAP